jgi:hypothetical protein
MSSWTRCERLSRSLAALAVLLIALLLASTPGAATATARNPRLGHVHTWAFAIGDGDLAGNLAAR